jgi:hypothetical protein
MAFLALIVIICMPGAALSDGGARAKISELKIKENIDETERWKLYYETIGREKDKRKKRDQDIYAPNACITA